jgi:nucleotide-binding universal stress UspA family protein
MDNSSIPTPGRQFRHILLATDIDGASAQAIDEAIDLAKEPDTVLIVLSVVPRGALVSATRYWGPGPERDRCDRRAREIVARAVARGAIATSVVWHGDPAEAILEATRSGRVDAVVLGSRRRRSFARIFGSVSSQATRGGGRPAVIVPA